MEIYYFGKNDLDIKNLRFLPELFSLENNLSCDSGDEKCIAAFDSINSHFTNIPVIVNYNDFFYLKMNHCDLPIKFSNKSKLEKFILNIFKY